MLSAAQSQELREDREVLRCGHIMTVPAHRWASGTCVRGHDVTDPANVRAWTNKAGVTHRECLLCRHLREAAYRAGSRVEPAYVFPPRECEQCGQIYHHSNPGETRRKWARRRYCSQECVAAMLVELRRDRLACGTPGRLSDAELARLRQAVGL